MTPIYTSPPRTTGHATPSNITIHHQRYFLHAMMTHKRSMCLSMRWLQERHCPDRPTAITSRARDLIFSSQQRWSTPWQAWHDIARHHLHKLRQFAMVSSPIHLNPSHPTSPNSFSVRPLPARPPARRSPLLPNRTDQTGKATEQNN